ncbi:MAG: hypothetical protein MJZ69_08910 [Bacteroidaceae bacterium]|nr:hypothetical protein [Bacteroidaceae bacterium]
MKRIKKSVWLPALMFIYATGMFVYFLPKNSEVGTTEKIITVAVAYAIILALFFMLRWKERLAKEREEDLKKNK